MATVDAVQKLDNVGKGPVGYWGVSMGTRFGVPLVAADSRIKAAVLGLYGLFPEGAAAPKGWSDDARKISVPLIFVFQRSDELMTLQNGIDLYDAFASKDKAMHINPGTHTGIPVSERETWVTVAEWMQTKGPMIVIPPNNKYGADNSVYVARILWETPNAAWDKR